MQVMEKIRILGLFFLGVAKIMNAILNFKYFKNYHESIVLNENLINLNEKNSEKLYFIM